jgi:glycogen(starch) synthase
MSPPAPNKVLMTTDTLGGVWTFAMELCAQLGARGSEIMLLSMGRLPDEAQRAEADAIPNLQLVPTVHRLEWMQNCENDVVEAGNLLLRLALEFRPDVVHVNGYYHAALRFNAPVLLTAHSCVSSWWRACKGGEPPASEWRQYEQWVKAAVRAADMLVAPTRAYLADFQNLHGAGNRLRVIWNGRDASLFRSSAKENVVFGGGRLWDEAKNIAVLCQAAHGLDAKIRVAGDDISPDGSTHDLKGVEFLGPLSRGQMTVEMGRAAVFASPALYEPFGLTILEAALSECALVLADIPTLRELWDGAAIFVDPHDVRGWHDTLSFLTRNPQRATEHGRRARSHALAYTSERMADAYCDAYGKLLSCTDLVTEAAA